MVLADLDMGNGKRLRPYQIRLIENVRALIKPECRRIIVNAPTGSGKTVIACALIKLSAEKGKRSMFLAPRRELIRQTSDHLDFCEVRHDFIAAGFTGLPGAQCVVASKDTLAARTLRSKKIDVPNIDLLLHDECHSSLASETMRLLESLHAMNPNLISIGLSATPGRADGKGLGDFWQAITQAAGYAELIEQGFLVPTRVFAPDAPDMRGVKSKDWDSEAAQRVDKPRLVGDVVAHWQKFAPERQTIVFGATVAHSIHLCDGFIAAGVRAQHIDQSTPMIERDATIKALKTGEIQVICNCDLLSLGFDEPTVSCVVLVAPSRSLVRYRQRAGRALRPSPGKTDTILLDHAGAVYMHGFPDEDIDWPLEKTRSIDVEYQAKRKEGKTREPIVCNSCHAVYSGRPTCPVCGSHQSRQGRAIAIQRGLLKEVRREKTKPLGTSVEDRARFWHKCLAVAAARGGTCGMAAGMYSHKVGQPPWATHGLPNMPRSGDWKRPAAEVFPQYVRAKAM